MSAACQPARPQSLSALLQRVAERDPDAMRRLYDETSPALFGLALHMVRRREWAEEVVQDAFVSIWRGAAGYQQRLSAPMPWMMAIVRNRTLDYLRQQRAFGASAETGWREELDETGTVRCPARGDLSAPSPA